MGKRNINKRIIFSALVIALIIIGIACFMFNKTSKSNEYSKIVVSTEQAGSGNLSKGISVLTDKESNSFRKSMKSLESSKDGIISIKFDKNASGSFNSLKKDDIFIVRPTKNKPSGVLDNGFAGKVITNEKVNDETVITASVPSIDELFTDLNISTNAKMTSKNVIKEELAEGVKINFGDNKSLFAISGEANNKNFNFKYKKGSSKTLIPDMALLADEISVNIKDLVICNIDENNKIVANGSAKLLNPCVKISMEYTKKGPVNIPKLNKCSARFITTMEDSLSIDWKGKYSTSNSAEKDKKEINLIFTKITGTKKEDGKIFLGNVLFDLGTFRIQPSAGEPINTTLGAALLFTTTINGEISVDAKFYVKDSTFVDCGINPTYKLVAAGDYPNPNITDMAPSEKQKDPKSGFSIGITGSLDGKLRYCPIGLDLNLYLLNIVPIKLTNDLALDIDGSISGTFATDKQELVDPEMSMTLSFQGKANLKLKIEKSSMLNPDEWKTVSDKELMIDLYDKILWEHFLLNTYNGSNVFQDGDWIYFSNSTKEHQFSYGTENQPDGSIYKMRLDGSGKVQLNSQNSSKIIVKDGWVYYSEKHEEESNEGGNNTYYYLYRMKTDGSNAGRLSGMKVSDMLLIKNNIFFRSSEDGKMYKMKLDGSECIKFMDQYASSIATDGRYIYYTYTDPMTYKNGIYKISINGTNQTKLYEGNFLLGLVIHNDYIYFSNAEIYRIKTDGTGFSKIRDAVNKQLPGDLTIAKNKLYFTATDFYSHSYLLSINPDGSGETKLAEGTGCNITDVTVSGDYIYYNMITSSLSKWYRLKLDGSDSEIFNQ